MNLPPTRPAFNLLDEAWIPMRKPNGDVVRASLTEVLLKARDFAGVAVSSPPAFVALHRILLAIVHRALTTHHGSWTDTDRAQWHRRGFPETALRTYLNEWRDRFCLFHPTTPFMQVAALATTEKTRNKVKPWTQIALEAATGNAPVVFAHTLDDDPGVISCAGACMYLLGFLQFTPGGLVKVLRTSDKAGPLANTAAVLPVGTTLQQSLTLALHPFDARRADDRPAWELEPPTVESLVIGPTVATGYNDTYTRLSRSVLLLPETDGAGIRNVLFAEGREPQNDDAMTDPMACHRINKEGKPVRVTFREGRAIWRDLPSLLPDPVRTQDVPPPVLGWAANLYQALGDDETFIGTIVAGVASDQAKMLRWRMERLALPPALLTEPAVAQEIRRLVRSAEEQFTSLRAICTDMIALSMRDSKHKDTKARARQLFDIGPGPTAYFSAAERVLPGVVQHIAAGDVDAAWVAWRDSLVDGAERAWLATRRSLGDAAPVFRAEALTRPWFSAFLSSLRVVTEEIPA